MQADYGWRLTMKSGIDLFKYFATLKVMSRIRISGTEHFLHENQTWGRALDFYLQENSYLKTRLAQVVDNITDKEFITLAEHFQNSFIHNDECIKDLQKDVSALYKLIKIWIAGTAVDEKKLLNQQNKLRNEMGYFEKDFALLKNKFNQYMMSLL